MARGLGLKAPPRGLHYWRVPGALGGLGTYANIKVEYGTQASPSFPSCTGFVAGGTLYDSDLPGFATAIGVLDAVLGRRRKQCAHGLRRGLAHFRVARRGHDRSHAQDAAGVLDAQPGDQRGLVDRRGDQPGIRQASIHQHEDDRARQE